MRNIWVGVTLSALLLVPPVGSIGAPEHHCVAFVLGEVPGGELILTEPECFSTYSQVLDRIGDAVEVGIDRSTESPAPEATFTLGRHFDGTSGTGSSISIVGSSCTGGYWNTGTGWENKISSSYNGCARLRHFDYANAAGSYEDTVGAGQTDNLIGMNNKTESVAYYSN